MLNIEPTYMLTIEPSLRCNMTCDFCYNSSIIPPCSKLKTINFEKIFLAEVFKEIDNLPYAAKSTFNLNVLGGEVLADFWPDSYLADFLVFVKKIHERCIPVNRALVIIFNTNLVHKNTSRWLAMFSSISKFAKVVINTSYDIYGRFKTRHQFEIFKRNLIIYEQYIGVINLIKTKEVLRIMVNKIYHSDLEKTIAEYFDLMYFKFGAKILIDEYVCSSEEGRALQCTNHENFLICKFFVSKYKTLNLYNFKTGKKNRCSFTPGVILDPEGKRLPDCIFASVQDKFIKDMPSSAKTLQEKLTVIHNKAANNLQCYSCVYYKVCPSACPMSMVTLIKDPDEACFIKQTLDYINENAIYD